MKAVIQRVKYASCTVNGEVIGRCSQGFLVLLGVEVGDDTGEADKMIKKLPHLRIFEDENGKMNLSCLDIGGEMLVISQFTLAADCSHGRRPSFIGAARPEQAIPLYEYVIDGLRNSGVKRVETGEFGADMAIELLNDGPVTIILDSKDLKS